MTCHMGRNRTRHLLQLIINLLPRRVLSPHAKNEHKTKEEPNSTDPPKDICTVKDDNVNKSETQ